MQLHKDDLVAAATAILDRYGIADLTMRRLARELAITPGALYWHFASKQELLGAVADGVLHPVHSDPRLGAGPDWQRRATLICARMRGALLAHTDGAELVSASFAAGQSRGVTKILEMLSATAQEAGLDATHAVLAARTLLYYILGATADEQSRRQWNALSTGPAVPAASETSDASAGFGFGLRLLIDGLAQQSARSGPDRMLDALVTVPPA